MACKLKGLLAAAARLSLPPPVCLHGLMCTVAGGDGWGKQLTHGHETSGNVLYINSVRRCQRRRRSTPVVNLGAPSHAGAFTAAPSLDYFSMLWYRHYARGRRNWGALRRAPMPRVLHAFI